MKYDKSIDVEQTVIVSNTIYRNYIDPFIKKPLLIYYYKCCCNL